MHKQLLMAVALAALAACRTPQATPAPTPAPGGEVDNLTTMTARFAPVDLTADISALPANERQALAKLVQASKIIDALFLRQVWAGNEAMLIDLVSDTSDEGRARLHYFLLNKGPWSRLDENKSFVPGAPAKPEAANFYPAGATKAEVDAWLKTLPDAARSEEHTSEL